MQVYKVRNFVVILAFLFSFCSQKKEEISKKIVHKTDSINNVVSKNYDTIIVNEFHHDELSKSFDIKVLVNRYRNIKQQHDSCIAKFTLFEKSTKQITDTFSISSNFYFKVFETKDNVRSYSTKINSKKDAVDNYYGDIVIADLDFDKKDDIAIINDTGGNGGSFYNFYIQKKNKKFKLDRFLTDSVVYFPHEIKDKTITTLVHAGACHLGKHIYTLNTNKQKWSEKSHVIIDVCK